MNIVKINLGKEFSNNILVDLFVRYLLTVISAFFVQALFSLATIYNINDFILFISLVFMVNELARYFLMHFAVELVLLSLGTIFMFLTLLSYGVGLQIFSNIVIFRNISIFLLFVILTYSIRAILKRGIIVIRKMFI